MPRGHVRGVAQGLHGDRTTTGAVCISSLPNATQGGRGVLRLGDTTTPCPRCGKEGVIVSSMPAMSWMGIATVLDGAEVRCDCPAGSHRVIAPAQPSLASQTTRIPAQPAATAANRSALMPNQPANGHAHASVPSAVNGLTGEAPGFYIVPTSMSREALETLLFPVPDPAVMRTFKALNPGTVSVKAGSLIVLSDSHNTACTYQEAQLMQAAQQVDASLDALTPDEADFLYRHGAQIAGFIGHTSTWLGVSAVVVETHLANLRNTLQAIERLHQDQYRQHGHLKSPQFFAERQRLLAQLDAHLLNATRLRGHTTLGDHPKLKTALGISSRSLVHHWDKAGGPGQIPGYSAHVEAVSRATQYMKAGGYIGMGLGGVSSLLAIQQVCNGGSAQACEKVKFTEVGKFVGSTGGGVAGGWASGLVSAPMCLAIGVATGGIGGVVCVAAVVGTGAWAGTTLGGRVGESMGEKIYQATQP